jgi:hypothetical protein
MVSAAGGKPLTEARETSAMSNTRSVPACEYLNESMICRNRRVFFQSCNRGNTFNFATTVAL